MTADTIIEIAAAQAEAALLAKRLPVAWHAATTDVMGVTRHHEAMVSFSARQCLYMLARTNSIATNPVLQRKIVETGGQCLREGWQLRAEDAGRLMRAEPPSGTEAFRVGQDIAATPGQYVQEH